MDMYGLLESANERDDLQRKAKRTNSVCYKLLANMARNRTTSLKRQLKRLFFQNSIQDTKGDSAKLWKALKRLLRNTDKKDLSTSINDKTDLLEIVTELNTFFQTSDLNWIKR